MKLRVFDFDVGLLLGKNALSQFMKKRKFS